MNNVTMFTKDNSLLVIVDIQEKLARTMPDLNRVVKNTSKMIKAAKVMDVPIVVTEQYPDGLGKTLPELESLLMNAEPIDKNTFSCCLEDRFKNALSIESRSHILLVGMEAHICVLQTALDLIGLGYSVGVIVDAVCSYKQKDMDVAEARMKHEGALLLTVEMIIYELMRSSASAEFKELLPVLKQRD